MVLFDGRDRDDGGTTCKKCGEKPASQAHHIFHKGSNGRFRYDRRNGLPLCAGCHLRERFDPAPVVVCAARYLGMDNFFALALAVEAYTGPYLWSRVRLEGVIVGMEEILSVEVLPHAHA
jgi:hypothetical protein